MQKLAESYQNVSTGSGSGLGAFMSDDRPEMDFDMVNLISTGQNRKMKKKMKKLKKKFVGDNSQDKIFKEMQKYKSSIVKTQ